MLNYKFDFALLDKYPKVIVLCSDLEKSNRKLNVMFNFSLFPYKKTFFNTCI